MPRTPKPWFRKDRKEWFVTISGKRIRLGNDKTQAHQKFHAILAKQLTLSEESLVTLLDDLLSWTKKNRSEGTYRFYFEHIQQFVDWLKASNRLDITSDDLTPDLVESFIDSCSPGRRNGAVQTIKRAYNWGIKRGRISRNPVASVEKPPQGQRKNYISDKTYRKMLEYSDQVFSDLLAFCWNTGCRPQEAWKLTDAFVDKRFRRCVIPCSQTKRKKGDRVIYCNAAAWIIILRLSIKPGFLFVTNNGTSWNKNSVGSRMELLKRKLGKRYALYDFRHTWITNKVKAGMDIHMIAKLAGTSIAMVERFYDQSDEDARFMLSLVEDAG